MRIGIVDFDTSHCAAFTQRLNHIDIAADQWVTGAKVVAGWPGDSAMMPERIPGYIAQMRGYGVPLVERMEDLFSQIDAVMITSQQGSRHASRSRPFLEAGIPTFIDKPFASSARDADTMIALATELGTPLMSSSALRYAPEVREALRKQTDLGRIVSADVWGSASLHDGNPGLRNYGVHGLEILYTLMGAGCQEVSQISTPGTDIVTGLWTDGRLGVLRGVREGQGGFGFTAHYEKGHFSATVQGAAFYSELLKAVVEMFTTRTAPIPLSESREIVALMDAAEQSSKRKGAVVPVG